MQPNHQPKKQEQSNQSDEICQISQNVTIYWNKQIGKGAFGVVFEGHYSKNRIQIPCAIKVITKPLGNSVSEKNYFQQEKDFSSTVITLCNEFRQEYLSKECPLIEIFEIINSISGEKACIVMEMCQNSLHSYKYFQHKMRATPYEAIRITKQIALGLKLFHSKNLIHRDLKPDNILLIKQPNKKLFAKIGDYGLVKNEADAKSSVGTITYMSPEVVSNFSNRQQSNQQVVDQEDQQEREELEEKEQQPQQKNKKKKNYTTKVDIWALGAILYELLTGKQLFVGSKIQLIVQDILSFGSFKQKWLKAKSFPYDQIKKPNTLTLEQKSFLSYYQNYNAIKYEPVVDLLDKMLQKDPNKRTSASDVYEECKKLMQIPDLLLHSQQFILNEIQELENEMNQLSIKLKKLNIDPLQKGNLNMSDQESTSSSSQFYNSDFDQISSNSHSLQINPRQINQDEKLIQSFQQIIEQIQIKEQESHQQRQSQPDSNTQIEIQKDSDILQVLSTIHSSQTILFQRDYYLFIKAYINNNFNKNLFLAHFLSLFRLYLQQQNVNSILHKLTIPINAIYIPTRRINPNENEIMEQQDIKDMNCFYVSFSIKLQSLHEVLLKFKDSPRVKANKSPFMILKKIEILLKISQIIQEMHKNNIFHGSLTTRNIYIDENYNIMIGYCNREETKINNFLHMRFEAAFKSKCQLKGTLNQEKQSQADLWALGIISHYLFSLKHLFQASFKVKDIVLGQKFDYLKLWRECNKYRQEREHNLIPNNPKFEQMQSILGEIPNESIAEIISCLLIENEGQQFTIEQVIYNLEICQKNQMKILEDIQYNEKEESLFDISPLGSDQQQFSQFQQQPSQQQKQQQPFLQKQQEQKQQQLQLQQLLLQQQQLQQKQQQFLQQHQKNCISNSQTIEKYIQNGEIVSILPPFEKQQQNGQILNQNCIPFLNTQQNAQMVAPNGIHLQNNNQKNGLITAQNGSHLLPNKNYQNGIFAQNSTQLLKQQQNGQMIVPNVTPLQNNKIQDGQIMNQKGFPLFDQQQNGQMVLQNGTPLQYNNQQKNVIQKTQNGTHLPQNNNYQNGQFAQNDNSHLKQQQNGQMMIQNGTPLQFNNQQNGLIPDQNCHHIFPKNFYQNDAFAQNGPLFKNNSKMDK